MRMSETAKRTVAVALFTAAAAVGCGDHTPTRPAPVAVTLPAGMRVSPAPVSRLPLAYSRTEDSALNSTVIDFHDHAWWLGARQVATGQYEDSPIHTTVMSYRGATGAWTLR